MPCMVLCLRMDQCVASCRFDPLCTARLSHNPFLSFSSVNLRKVCNYIQQRSQVDFQCIVISLKDMFYERSQSLVGICKDVGTNSSRTLTLDLTRFDKRKQDEEEERAATDGKRRTKRKAKSEGQSSSRKRLASDSPGTITTQ